MAYLCYWIPNRMARLKLRNDDLCWQCNTDIGTMVHMLYECDKVKELWEKTPFYWTQWANKGMWFLDNLNEGEHVVSLNNLKQKYKLPNNDFCGLKMAWERDLGETIKDEM
uniref:Reverse transcriptase zinc-binding domain-containing protein n=1 Tax=Cyprinus carpio TaxID=7962 RepID=A0A8C2PQ41_CYPCA